MLQYKYLARGTRNIRSDFCTKVRNFITMLRILNASTKNRHVLSHISYYFNSIAFTHLSTMQTRRLEVQRKFFVTPAAITSLCSNGAGSRFNRYESLGKQTTHDIYYDRNHALFSKGVYIIRRRNGQWEAKVRTGGDSIHSALREIDGNGPVKEVIEENLAICCRRT